MKPMFIGLVLIAVSAPAYAQYATPYATPILPVQTPGPPPSGTFAMSGCVNGPGTGTGLFTMVSPSISPSSATAGSNAGYAPPPVVTPILPAPYVYASPSYELPPSVVPAPVTMPPAPGAYPMTGEAGAVGTVGTTPGSAISAVGVGPSGYRLTGSDLSSWVGRRVQMVGTMNLVPPEFPPGTDTSNPATFQEFRVLSVVPLTGACPQR
jgi:hypothetical protein